MKIFRLFLLLLAAAGLAACSHSTRKTDMLRSVATHRADPAAAFVSGGKLFIRYAWENEPFYFTADLKETGMDEALLSLRGVKKGDVFPDKQPVAIVGREWGKVIKQTLLPLVPEHENQGLIIFLNTQETMLLRRADGSADLILLKDAPGEVEIVGKLDAEQFARLAYEQLKKMTAVSGTSYTRFLLRLDNVPMSPYVYVDTQNDLGMRLVLPDYYEVKKEMTSLGFSASFIYSFFIKSHLWGAVKAPFTTSHRLFAAGTSSVYTMFPPHVGDLDEVPPLNLSGDEMDLSDFNKWLDKHISKQNYKASVTLLIDGQEFFPHFMLAMQRAQESIFTSVYIFMADPYGLSIADVMKKRAAEGIDVRVVVDELNTVLNSGKNPELKPAEDFVMPKYITSYIRKKSRAKARTHLNPWSTFDHSKVYIIDRKLAYTGGMNIGEEYRYTWHDMMVALEGPVVGRLVKNFYQNWSFTGWGGDWAAGYRKLFSKKQREVNRAAPGMIDVRLMYTKPNDSEIFNAQREAIRRAKKRIYIENAYFSDDRIVKELIAARGRGVDVRVILPGKNDVGIMDKNNRFMANKLFKNGVRVYFYNGMSHVKAAVYDGWAVVGSANFDKMSLYVNKEMSLGISDPAFVSELTERLFEKDFENSEEMTEPMELAWTYFLINGLTNQL
ncbi:MAG: phosphatidylserine/phosphatidylglycerophosphate/cardiolipin synthase family protein [Elusimicrobiaceae bacterium]|nr:phosphatidylserine/phosphatidylglycerophosphate/cardiolipin synthase family protein [Elusimicrobiaceae bacterium]